MCWWCRGGERERVEGGCQAGGGALVDEGGQRERDRLWSGSWWCESELMVIKERERKVNVVLWV